MAIESIASIASRAPVSQADESSGHTPAEGWQQFYNTLSNQSHLPNAQMSKFGEENTVFYAAYLDLSDVQKQLSASAITADIVTIYTDVLHIGGALNWQVGNNQALVIYARWIDFAAGSGLSVALSPTSPGGIAALTIFALGTNGQISVNAAGGQGGTTLVSNANIAPGIALTYTLGGSLQTAPQKIADGIPINVTDEQVLYLVNTYIYAALASTSYRLIALDILLWVNQWAAAITSNNSSELAQLYFASSNLASLLQSQVVAAQNGATWVPYLSQNVYANLAVSMGQALQNDEQNYLVLFSAKNASAEFIAAAKAMLATYSNAAQSNRALLAQANQDYQNALGAMSNGLLLFKNQQASLKGLANDLNAAIEAYERTSGLLTALQIGMAIIQFGAGIAELAVGDPEGGAAAAGAAGSVASAAQTLAKAMQALIKLAKAINECYELAEKLYDASQNLSSPAPVDGSTSAQSAGIVQNDPTNSIAAWDVFKINADSSLEDVISLKIDGGQAYKDGLEILAVYGKSLSALQLAVAQAGQKCVALSTQLAYAEKNVQAIQNLLQQLTAGEADIARLQQLFFRQSLDARMSLFSVLTAYQATYYYWALQPSSINVTLTDLNSLTSSVDTAVALGMDNYRALMNGQSQTMHLVEVHITDPSVITTLNQKGATQWTIGLSHPSFSNLNRVRFTCVRIWLLGSKLYPSTSQTTVSIAVKTSGNYLDRHGAQQFQFSSPAFNKMFSYYVNDSDIPNPDFDFGDNLKGTVSIDGSSYPQDGNDYFIPTPFSDWSIDLTALSNSINWANVEKITMQFQGSAMA